MGIGAITTTIDAIGAMFPHKDTNACVVALVTKAVPVDAISRVDDDSIENKMLGGDQ